MFKILLIILGIIIIIGIFIFAMHSNDKVEIATSTTKKLIYNNSVIYNSNEPIFYTSDGNEKIIFGNSSGLYIYDVDSAQKTKISQKSIKGLARDPSSGIYYGLESNGNLYTFNNNGVLNQYDQYVENIYDTMDGFFIKYTNGNGYSGSNHSKNLGNYGNLNFIIS
jgi:hypothetical protein